MGVVNSDAQTQVQVGVSGEEADSLPCRGGVAMHKLVNGMQVSR